MTTQGGIVPGIPRHYIRIHPTDIDDPSPDEDPNHGCLTLNNIPPGEQFRFPARDIVDAGFLELVRYGIRRAGDSLVEDSLRVVDAVLKVDTPLGPCWRRYNHDGYGQTGQALRIQTPDAFRLRYTRDAWQTIEETESSPTGLGIGYVDIPISEAQRAPIRFTFYRPQPGEWEGKDYTVEIAPPS